MSSSEREALAALGEDGLVALCEERALAYAFGDDHYLAPRVLLVGHVRKSGKLGILDLCFAALDEHEVGAQVEACARIVAAEQLESIAAVFTITEAWLALGDLSGARPSERPDRVECVVVVSQDRSRGKRMRAYALERDGSEVVTARTLHLDASGPNLKSRFFLLDDVESEEDFS